MSTGAVFANFSDKSDLFREIMITDMGALADAMREAGDRGATAADALLKIFMAGYAFYKTQLPLARAAFSVGWSPEDGPALRRAPPVHLLNELMAAALIRGVEAGELAEGCEVELRAHMLFETYLSNYPQAIFESWSLEALEARSRDQIRILLAGARRV
jgi:AcrR family transcriptional regulator